MSSSGWLRLPIYLIVAVGVLCYANTFSVPFVLDDVSSILANPSLQHPTFSLKPRLLGELSFVLNYSLHGFSLPGYHLFNLVLHLCCALLVYLMVMTLFRTPLLTSHGEAYAERYKAAAVALLFVAHPLQTAAVTYLAQRVTLLAAFFYLGAVLFYLKSRLSATVRSTAAFLLLALFSAAAALLSKENAVTIPLTLLLCEFTFFNGAVRKRLVLCGLSLLPIFAVVLLTNRGLLLQTDLPAAFLNMTVERGAPTRLSYLLTQFPVVIDYLRLLFVPLGQNLDHDVPLHSSVTDPVVMAAFLSLLVLVVAAMLLWLKGRSGENSQSKALLLTGFGTAWFFITISLESGLVPIRDVMFEQRVYLPSVGFFIAVTSLLWLLTAKMSPMERAARNFSVLLVILVTTLAVLTIARNCVWHSEVTLWEDAAAKSPAKGRTHGALGHAYQRAGKLGEAEQAYKMAVSLSPQDHIARNNLGAVYLQQRRFLDAVGEFKEALLLAPSTAATCFNLGLAYGGLGRTADAAAAFAEAVRLRPDYREAQENLAVLQKAMAR